jgi:hypothetical protein
MPSPSWLVSPFGRHDLTDHYFAAAPIPVGIPRHRWNGVPISPGLNARWHRQMNKLGLPKLPTIRNADLGGFSRAGEHGFHEGFRPSRLWSVGPQVAETSSMRETPLPGGLRPSWLRYHGGQLPSDGPDRLSQVEDNLAALRILENEARVQRMRSVQPGSLSISTYQYKGGTASYP